MFYPQISGKSLIQAKSSLVPNIDYDLICWHQNVPVSLSIKTSLRERYKQADLESMALRQVYRNADCYLITLTDECLAMREKIIRGELFALKDCLRADNEDFHQLITTLKTKQFAVAQPIQPVEGSLIVP